MSKKEFFVIINFEIITTNRVKINMLNLKKYYICFLLVCLGKIYGGQSCSEFGTLLFDIFQMQKILTEDIFCMYGARGNIVRPCLTNPILLYYNNTQNTFSNIGASVYMLSSREGVFFKDINNISGFIDFVGTAKNVVNYSNAIENTQYELLNFPFLAESMYSVAIKNKMLGFVLEGTYEYGDSAFFYCQMPFQYSIFYPSLPSEIQGRFSTAVGYALKPSSDDLSIAPNPVQKSSRDVIIENTVVDSFGLTNTILGCGKKICDERIIIEGRIFLPGKTFKSGLVGGQIIDGFSYLPNIPVKVIIDNIIEQKELPYSLLLDLEMAGQYISKRVILGSYYYDPAEEPCRVSPSCILKMPIGYSFYADFYVSYIYSFSKEARGIAMQKNNSQLESKIANINSFSGKYSEEESCNIVNTALDVWKNYLVPVVCSGVYIPGQQFQGSFAIHSSASNLIVALGIDAWHQMESSFRSSRDDLRICAMNAATQCNLFCNFEYYFDSDKFPLMIQCILQATVFNRNIQEDFGGKLSIGMQY